MFAAKIALLSAVALPALAVPSQRFDRHVHRSVPSQYERRGYAKDEDLLEPYHQYNTRYMSFNCPAKHNTDFFDLCCHPLLKDQEVKFDDACYEECDDDDGEHGGESSAPGDVAPKTTSAPAVTTAPNNAEKPKPTSTKIVTSTVKATTSHPAATTSAAPSSGSGEWFTGGHATFFYQGGNAGACGTVHSDNDLVVAIDKNRYGLNFGVRSALCGRKVHIVNAKDSSKSVTALVADVCPTCTGPEDGKNSLDLSVAAFKKLGSESEGQIDIKWQFV